MGWREGGAGPWAENKTGKHLRILGCSFDFKSKKSSILNQGLNFVQK
jgi:hypothetical protein